MNRGARSLKARAIAHLARREHSALELRRKLVRHAADEDDPDAILQLLKVQGLQSDARFAASVVRRRADRFGSNRILHELREHGIDPELVGATAVELRDSEFARALALDRRRFGEPSADLSERARRARFLAARGFGGEIIRRVLSLKDADR